MCKLVKWVRNCVVFWKNLHSWQKFYTTAGRDGRDKFQVCFLPPLSSTKMLSNYHPLLRQRILYCVSKIANRDCADLSSRPEGIWVLSPSLPPLYPLHAIICYLVLLFLAKLHWKVLHCKLLCWARKGSLHHWQRCRNAIHWLDLVWTWLQNRSNFSPRVHPRVWRGCDLGAGLNAPPEISFTQFPKRQF